MILSELHQATRTLRKRPFTTVVVVLTLALGIGANTAVFSLVHQILLRPLPFPEGDRLVRIYQTYEVLRESPNPRLQRIWNRLPLSYLNALEQRRGSRTLSGIGLYEEYSVTVSLGEEPRRTAAARMDSAVLGVLGVEPLAGRAFHPEEIEIGARVVLLSEAFRRQAFGEEAEVLGRSLRIDDQPHTVIGVLPSSFRLPRGFLSETLEGESALWTPLRLSERDRGVRGNFAYSAIGRLAPGATLEAARTEAHGLAGALVETYPEDNADTGFRLVPLKESLVGDTRPLLVLLLAAVALVLLVASTNVAHLLLVQATARRRELAIRDALGAGRGRLVGQLLVESLLLAAVGGIAGLALAALGGRVFLTWLPGDLPRLVGAAAVPLNGSVLLFTFGISLLTALLCGLLPAFSSTRTSLQEALQESRRRRCGLRTHDALVVFEIALTLVLTVGAGLLVHSFLRLSAVDPGFRTQDLLAQEIRLPAWRYGEEYRRAAFAEQLLTELQGLPGVWTAALTTRLPFQGRAEVWGFQIVGRDPENGSEVANWTQGRSASMKFITPDYFRTLGIAVLEGRSLTVADAAEPGRVVIVNRTLAERHWPEGAAVGQSVVLSAAPEPYTVVGVVETIRHDGLEAGPGELMYQPWNRRPGLDMFAVIAPSPPKAGPPVTAAALRGAIRRLDPDLPLAPVERLEALLAESIQAPRARTFLLCSLAAVALFLALIGTYAVMAYTVQQRVPEMGIRLALGATAGRIRALILRRTLGLSGLGLALGAVAALFAVRILRGMLFSVSPTDPLTFGVAALLLVAVTVASGLLPARKAARVDPARTLRAE